MKKLIIAAAVASVLAPATVLADTTLYGALRLSAVGGDKGTGDIGGVKNNASRIGLKGTYGEDGGLQGFFNLQGGIDVDGNGLSGTGSGGDAFSSRFAFAGVKGGFGKAVAGRISTPYKMAGLKIDPFYDTSAGPLNGGSNYGLSGLTNGWTNNAIGYVSPKLGGAVTINVTAFLNKEEGTTPTGSTVASLAAAETAAVTAQAAAATAFAANSSAANDTALNAANIALSTARSRVNNVDPDNAYNVGATYSKNGLTASVQYLTGFAGNSSNDNAVRVTGGYKTSAFSIGASFEDIDVRGANNDHTNTYVAGTYKVAPKTTLAASFGSIEDNGVGARDSAGDGFTVGVFQKVASKTTISALYSEVDYDLNSVGDRDVFALGLIQKF